VKLRIAQAQAILTAKASAMPTHLPAVLKTVHLLESFHSFMMFVPHTLRPRSCGGCLGNPDASSDREPPRHTDAVFTRC
jgi:hypothetical protein